MTQRINYIDALRGLAIFCVVFLHLKGFSLHLKSQPFIADVMASFFIPLFFFISGFVGFKNELLPGYRLRYIWNKTRSLLIPTIVFFGLATWHFNFSPTTWLHGGTKGGYWFAYVLFQLFVIYWAIKIIIMKVGFKRYNDFIWVVLLLLSFIGCYSLLNTPVGEFLSINMLIYSGYVYFFVGILAGKYKDVFLKLQTNKWYLWGLVTFTAIEWNLFPIHWTLHSFCPLLIVFALFYNERHWFDGNSFLQKILPLFGRNSLAIYFIHYWLIFNLPNVVTEWLDSLDGLPCFVTGGSSSFALFLVLTPFVIMICLACCLIQHMLSFIPYASIILFGKK